MIVCHCNLLTSQAIDNAMARWRVDNPGQVATPGALFAALDAVVACGGCMPLVVAHMARHAGTPPFHDAATNTTKGATAPTAPSLGPAPQDPEGTTPQHQNHHRTPATVCTKATP